MVALLFTVLAVGCGGGNEEATRQAGKSAQLFAEEASLDGIHSGETEAVLEVARPTTGETAHMQSRALFRDASREDPPRFDMTIQSHGALAGRRSSFFGAFLLLPSRAVLFYRGRTYQPRRSTLNSLRSTFVKAQKTDGPGNATACTDALGGEKITHLLRNFRGEGRRRDHDGTPVTLIGADLDIRRTFEAFERMAQSPACRAQLKAVGLPTGAQLQVVAATAAHAFEGGHVQLAIDRSMVLRDLSAEVTAQGSKGDQLEISFKWLLEDANDLKELPNPTAESPLPPLLHQLNTNTSDLAAVQGDRLLLGLLEFVGEEMTGR